MVQGGDTDGVPVPTPDAVTRRLGAALAVGDRQAAVAAILEAADAGMPLPTLYDEVVEPFLVSIGASWQDGSTSVWEEHIATSAVRTAVEALYPRVLAHKATVPPVAKTVLFACPPEETHDLGLRLLSDRFDLHGFHTVFVGASTPAEEIVAAAQAREADLVCLSVSTHFHRASLRRVVHLLESGLPGVRILVGGAAFRSASPEWADYLVGDLSGLMDELAGADAAGAGGRGASKVGRPREEGS